MGNALGHVVYVPLAMLSIRFKLKITHEYFQIFKYELVEYLGPCDFKLKTIDGEHCIPLGALTQKANMGMGMWMGEGRIKGRCSLHLFARVCKMLANMFFSQFSTYISGQISLG